MSTQHLSSGPGSSTHASQDFQRRHSLLLCNLDRSCLEVFLDWAAAKSIRGATILTGRGRLVPGEERCFGEALEEQRALVLIILSQSRSRAFLEAAYEEHGLETESRGCFAELPLLASYGLQSSALSREELLDSIQRAEDQGLGLLWKTVSETESGGEQL